MNGPQAPHDGDFQAGEDPDLLVMGVPEPPGRRRRRAAPLAGVAALALVGGAGVGYAATHAAPAKAAVNAGRASFGFPGNVPGFPGKPAAPAVPAPAPSSAA